MTNEAEAELGAERAGLGEMSPANGSASPTRFVEGIVTGIAHGFFEVAGPSGSYLCTLRGRLRKTRPLTPPRKPVAAAASRFARPVRQERRTAPIAPESRPEAPMIIAPGDRVRITVLGTGQGIIEDVLPRRTALRRARSETGAEHVMLANLDHAVLVFAAREPEPHFGMLDRYLALCEHAGVDSTICINKVDLGVPDGVEAAVQLYRGLGYRVLQTSAATGEGVEQLRERLSGRTSLLTGPSGVGKSSLMNDLLPEASQRVAEISEATGKGRHTTTGARLLQLPEGGWLADSAGIRELALWNVPADDLARAFLELRPVADDCEYEDCAHGSEDEGCALRRALEEGAISPSRWASFERLLQEAQEAEGPEW